MAEATPSRTVTGYWVKVKNGEVLEVWNEQPNQDELDSGLWTAAVEIFPEYTPGREEVGGHTIDISQNPIQIVYEKITVEVADRVEVYKYHAAMKYSEVISEESSKPLADTPEEADIDRITAAKNRMDAIKSDLDAAVTHDDVDNVDKSFSV